MIGSRLPGSDKDELLLNADHSEIRITGEDEFELRYYDNVKFDYKGGNLLCDTAVYHQSRGVLEFWGNVRYADSMHHLSSTYLKYLEDENRFHATGDCEILVRDERVKITGEKIDYDRNSEELTATGSPHLMVDYDDPAAMIGISSDTLHYVSPIRQGRAIDNVVITKSSMRATCDLCEFFPDSNRIVLYGDPRAQQRNNELDGDTMTISLKNRLLDQLFVSGNGCALYRSPVGVIDTVFTESRIEAKSIRFYFESEVLKKIVSAGNSYSWYLPAPEDTLAEGMNEVSGDSILLFFEKSGLDHVEVNNSCVGKFFSQRELDSLGNISYLDTVKYESANLNYATGDRIIRLSGASEVRNKTITLNADTIIYNTVSKDLRAYSALYVNEIDDTEEIGEDEKVVLDTVFVPVVLRDGTDEMTGDRLAYNLETKRGKVRETDTELENAYYHGETVRKMEEDVLLVDKGRYTTCDLDVPHYHFGSSNMKLISGDRVIARPIILYIEQIPVFYAPFFVFSIKKGRHSGFLPFHIGTWERGGRYVRNLGYYWAASEYWDMDAAMSLEERIGVKFDGTVNYAKRYVMRGSVRGSYARDSRTSYSGRTISHRWSLTANHSHTLSPTASISGSGTFVSDKSYTTEISNDIDERRNRNLRSQISFSKRWERTSLSAVVQSTKNLDDESSSLTAPSLRFSLGSRTLFPQPEGSEKSDQRWYQSIRLSYSSDFRNYQSKSKSGDDFSRRKYARGTHRTSLSAPQNLFRYITMNPSVNFTENWFMIFPTDISDEQELKSDKFLRSWTSSMSMSARTTLYGYFFPPIPGLIGIRHSMSPSLSYSYRPKSVLNADEAGYVGASSSRTESKSMSVSLSNLFQMKYKSGETEKKLDLFNLSTSTSYDFTREERKWSKLSTSLRTTSIPRLSIQLQATHDLYNPVTLDFDPFRARLTNISVSSGFSMHGRRGASSPDDLDGRNVERPGSSLKMPWSANFGHRYTESRNLITGAKSITHWITSSASFDLTRNWHVDISQNYDIRRKLIVSRSINIVRDLHCWEARFSWIPNGSLKGYYFKLFVKQIPDIKFEKSKSPLRGTLFN